MCGKIKILSQLICSCLFTQRSCFCQLLFHREGHFGELGIHHVVTAQGCKLGDKTVVQDIA